ncbi:class 3 adenylate cyclase/rubredoxin [Planomicrobium koreense]|uniref:Class 3 adenylate cyclase/rubredoxin n=1 Tax=Planococcus koreensis TaxID=112331 RepID=A0A7W8FU03_9BACL|nr:adenylate/guanylate cyclase domain-containing protein [Planococcus koreensis]MBB5179332.1 class 3 adenylate cyclase/rubredoxin [Planococcus koreensis]
MEFKARTYIAEKEYPVSKETAWGLLADNNRMNRYIGLFPVVFSGVAQEEQGIFFRNAKAKALGVVPISWQEYPFEWREHESYQVERRYMDGPMKNYLFGVEFLESVSGNPDCTLIRVTGEFVPRNALGIAAIALIAAPSVKKTIGYMDDFLLSGAKEVFEAPQKSPNHKVDVAELARLEGVLRKYPVDGELVNMLCRYLVNQGDHDVAHIETYAVAQQWGEDPDKVLRILLYAAKAGMLNLSWNLMCPNCRVSKEQLGSLEQLQPDFHCDLCGVVYDANFDQFVELHFSVHPSIRKAYAEIFCVGAPTITPHVKVQKVLKHGESAEIAVPSIDSPLRLRVLQANAIADVSLMGDAGEITYDGTRWSADAVAGASIVRIRNASATDIVVALEETAWKKETVTAAKVTALQEFRDLFSSEVLSPGQNISIGHVTILFTDLVGSTSLYESVGDSSAYGQVRNHFDFLAERIACNSGSIVKTIGDAVMAVFHLPADGLNAALEIQRDIAAFNDSAKEDFMLRVGLFSGPAIAVNSNGRLDYFGRTVNISARIQAQGHGGDIVFGKEYVEQAQLKRLLKNAHLDCERFSAKLKGIEGNMELIRVKYKELRVQDNAG